MKKIALCSAFVALLSSSVLADEFVGSRAGIGFSHLKVESDNYGNGFKVEYGYDFSNIIGFDLSYEKNNKTLFSIVEFESNTIKVATDIGYVFVLKDFFSGESFLKPYVKVGFQRFDASFESPSTSSTYRDTSSYYGLGLRLQHDVFYADFSLDYAEHDDDGSDQTALTIGLLF